MYDPIDNQVGKILGNVRFLDNLITRLILIGSTAGILGVVVIIGLLMR